MMRRRHVLVFLAGAAAVWGAGPLVVPGAGAWAVAAARAAVPAGAVRAAGPWGRAIEVPGLGALNKDDHAKVESVSCTSAGNCAAGGYYQNRGLQGFVAGERNGRWGRAIEVPGLGAMNVGGGAEVVSVSCGSADSCAAGGYYAYDETGFRFAPFVAAERGGRWGKAVALPGDGGVNSISCTSADNCLAGGEAADVYFDAPNTFVVQQRAGRWRSVRSVPGLLPANGDVGGSWINSVACPSAGNCAVGGGYEDQNGNQDDHGFVAAERNGRWGKAIQVPGLAALNTGGNAEVNSVSCAPAGYCAAGGRYTDRRRNVQGFVAVEKNGHWGQAIAVPGLGALNAGGVAAVVSVSCGSVGNCTAGGYYTDGRGPRQGFVT